MLMNGFIRFTQLEKSKQYEIAQLVGATPELILDHLMEVNLATTFFLITSMSSKIILNKVLLQTIAKPRKPK